VLDIHGTPPWNRRPATGRGGNLTNDAPDLDQASRLIFKTTIRRKRTNQLSARRYDEKTMCFYCLDLHKYSYVNSRLQ
jgi:hypothetical protein